MKSTFETANVRRRRLLMEREKEEEKQEELERQRLNSLTTNDLTERLFEHASTQERWRFEELLDEYIDKRIEKALAPYALAYKGWD